jgi:cardiolipin synthase
MAMTLPAIESNLVILVSAITFITEVLGVLTAIHAIMSTRTPQGTIAWIFPLVLFPFVTLPLYWIFGRDKFSGYIVARRQDDSAIGHIIDEMEKREEQFRARLDEEAIDYHALESLATLPFTTSNAIELLVDGQATFDAIFDGIERAEKYILVQFFIVKNDELGGELKRRLIEAAKRGVRVYFLYDEIGSHKLPKSYVRELRAAGATIDYFHSTKGRKNRFQLNFRNHRKIVIVDGLEAYVGGHNVGDEYMGRNSKVGHWRDTHVKMTGPCVQCVQLSFLEDWHWATHEIPDLNWEPRASDEGNKDVLVLPTGPADKLETCGLFFAHAIHSARQRVWIASPYFVPDSQVISALQLAALKGLDVRIMLPGKPDHKLVWLSSYAFIEATEPGGVKFYRYQSGFLHQKVMLIDDQLACVGTANLDNRSFRLNFEITVAVADEEFSSKLCAMLENDFSQCNRATAEDLRKRGFFFKLLVRLARLTAPIQ